jgi:serine/threonine protein kinase
MVDWYVHLEKIGSGGLADVYKVKHGLTGQIFAKKILRVPDKDNLVRFRRERDYYQEQVSNRHVIDVFDSKLEGPAPYLILAYSPLGSLQKFVSNREDWKRIAGWVCDIAIGLSPTHQRGGFHGDPKPSNFLRFPDKSGGEYVVIIDFGLGQRPKLASGPMTRSPRGTPEYMDPDLNNGGPYTWRHDIYALGVTMRELLTGSRTKSLFLPAPLPGPLELGRLIDRMTGPIYSRPTLSEIYRTLRSILNPIQVPALATQASGVGWLIVGLVTAAVAYATSNTYDPKVDRFRDSKGRFKGGRWD